MQTLQIQEKEGYAILQLDRGRANPINQLMVDELLSALADIESNDTLNGLIITGKPNFFTAGLDIVELYNYDDEAMAKFWDDFMMLIHKLVAFKKPLIASITGHSPAGGCVIAICCDYRVMAKGKYTIGLNEIPVGITVPNSIFQLYAQWDRR